MTWNGTNKVTKEVKVAWLLPVFWYYWQPTISEFTKLYPRTQVFTALFPGFSQGYENSVEVNLVGDFKVVNLERKAKGYGSNMTYLSPKIVKPLVEYRPDIVFTSSFGVWTILAIACKLIFRWQVIIAYEGSSPSVDYLHSPLRIWLRRIMVWLADGCITNTERGKKYLVKDLKANSDLVIAKPYEIPSLRSLQIENIPPQDLTTDLATNLTTTHKKPIFLFVGRLIPHKGVSIILEACQILKASSNLACTVLIVGDGDQKSELEDYCQVHQLTDTVKLLGRVDYSSIAQYYQQADVFILPTWEDTWGVVTSEVMLFGKPVLCSVYAGSSELIEDGKNGYVFDPANPQQLADLMSKFIMNPDLVSRMGQQSQAVMQLHTPEQAAKSLSSIIG